MPVTHGSYYEVRPPALDGTGEISLRDLVKFVLAMRPDRIVVGEVRGAEAFELSRAVNAGCGFLCTVHANSAGRGARRAGERGAHGGGERHRADRAQGVLRVARRRRARRPRRRRRRRRTRSAARSWRSSAVVPALRDDFTVEPLFVRERIGRAAAVDRRGAGPARAADRACAARRSLHVVHARRSGRARHDVRGRARASACSRSPPPASCSANPCASASGDGRGGDDGDASELAHAGRASRSRPVSSGRLDRLAAWWRWRSATARHRRTASSRSSRAVGARRSRGRTSLVAGAHAAASVAGRMARRAARPRGVDRGRPLPRRTRVGALADDRARRRCATRSRGSRSTARMLGTVPALEVVKESLADPTSDRVVEVLILAYERGGPIVREILDDLVVATTKDLKVLDEIESEGARDEDQRACRAGPAVARAGRADDPRRARSATSTSRGAGVLVVVVGAVLSGVGYVVDQPTGARAEEQRVFGGRHSPVRRSRLMPARRGRAWVRRLASRAWRHSSCRRPDGSRPRVRPYTVAARARLGARRRRRDGRRPDPATASGRSPRLFGPPRRARSSPGSGACVERRDDEALALQLRQAGFDDVTPDEYRTRSRVRGCSRRAGGGARRRSCVRSPCTRARGWRLCGGGVRRIARLAVGSTARSSSAARADPARALHGQPAARHARAYRCRAGPGRRSGSSTAAPARSSRSSHAVLASMRNGVVGARRVPPRRRAHARSRPRRAPTSCSPRAPSAASTSPTACVR